MRHLETVAAAAEIADEILGARLRPLVLISTVEGDEFAYDPEFVARELGESVDVITIPTGEITYALERLLPEKAHVFGGAARSYPPDFGAAPDWRRSVLRFPGRHDVNDVIEDALAQVTTAATQPTIKRRRWVSATVELVSGASGNVARLDSGERVIVVADRLPPRLSLAVSLVVGGPVEGWLTDRDLAPEPAEVDLSRYNDGAATLTRVVKATELRAQLSLHPSMPDVVLRRRDVIPGVDNGENADVRVTDILSVGQTVRARITRAGANVGLSLVDVNDNLQLVEPPPLLRGGSPWLQEGVHAEPARPVATDNGTPGEELDPQQLDFLKQSPVPQDAAIATASFMQLRDEVAELRGAIGRLGRDLRAGTDLETLAQLGDEVASLSAELHRERDRRQERDRMLARLNQELREARSARPDSAASDRHTSREAWPSGEAWVRHEVTSAWAARTVAAEKGQYPLGDYTIGPRFVESLEVLDGGQLTKALRAVVDVVTARAAEIPGRELHRLRTGTGGDDPYVERVGGGKCWRAAIETNAPGARRLHYWQLPAGRIELSRVVLHDDFAP